MKKIYTALCILACTITLYAHAMEQNTNDQAPSYTRSTRLLAGIFLTGWAWCDSCEAKYVARTVQQYSNSPYLMDAFGGVEWLQTHKQRLSLVKMRARCTGTLGVGLLAWEIVSFMRQDTQSSKAS